MISYLNGRQEGKKTSSTHNKKSQQKKSSRKVFLETNLKFVDLLKKLPLHEPFSKQLIDEKPNDFVKLKKLYHWNEVILFN